MSNNFFEYIPDKKISNCPFCGGEATLTFDLVNRGPLYGRIKNYYIICNECESRTAAFPTIIKEDFLDPGSIIIEKNGAKDAIDAWNKRCPTLYEQPTHESSGRYPWGDSHYISDYSDENFRSLSKEEPDYD